MDQELENAAKNGDVGFLRRAVAEKSSDYFLTQAEGGFMGNFFNITGANILHLAALNNQVEFVRTAMEILPKEVILQLLSQGNKWGEIPLHTAASYFSYLWWSSSAEMVKVMLEFYKSSHSGPPIAHHSTPWWLAVDQQNRTVLHSALYNNEENAMELLSMADIELMCNIVDNDGNSPLFLAVKEGYNRVAEKILTSSCSYSLSGAGGSTALHFAPKASENVLRLLLQKNPEMLDVVDHYNGYNVLHQWIKINEVWPFELLLKGEFSAARSKVFRDLIYKVELNMGRSALHFAAELKFEIGRAIIDGYEQEMKAGIKPLDVPWKIKDKAGDTPLHVAIKKQNEEFVLHMLSLDSTFCQAPNSEGFSLLYAAVLNGCGQVAEEILRNHDVCFNMCLNDEITMFKIVAGATENVLRLLLQKHPEVLNVALDVVDYNSYTVLHHWVKLNEVWPFELLLREDFSAVNSKVFRDLIYKVESNMGRSPLHFVAEMKFEIGRAIIDGYEQEMKAGIKPLDVPWKIKDKAGDTPLHVAIKKQNEEFVLHILSLDSTFCQAHNSEGFSLLYAAVLNGCGQVAEEILRNHDVCFNMCLHDEITMFKIVVGATENVLRLLLQKHPEVLDAVDYNSYTVLHHWVKLNEVWPFELLLREDFSAVNSKVFRDLIYKVESNMGRSPLHFVAEMKFEIGRAIIDGYEQEMKAGEKSLDVPWKIKDKAGDTPLHVAIKNQNQEFALCLLSLDPTLSQARNHEGCSSLYVAVLEGCDRVIEDILTNQGDCFSMLRNDDGTTVLHLLKNVSEEIGRKLIEKYWWMISLPNNIGRTALDEAKQANIPWAVHFLEHPSTIKKEPFNWIKACEREEDLWALFVFIEHYQDVLQNSCRELNDTPLHHIKLQTYGDYVKLLKNPYFAELKNAIDFDGATPLHRALERKDMNLAKALLVDSNIDQNIKDRYGRTIVSLLAELCRENKDWEIMCNQLKIYPLLRTSYIDRGTNLDQMRNTLSVVATLLATITFAAGFTVPGGLDDKSGNAILAKKAAFLVFILADAYAFCMSILVLFCLIWSMVSDHDMSLLSVDRSIYILMQSLYGTMVAFMTGIYTVIAHDSIWAAIIIFVMCCFIGVSVNKTILHKVLSRLIPTAIKDQKDRAQFSEKAKSIPPKNSSSLEEKKNLINGETEALEDENPSLKEGKNIKGTISNQLHKLKSFLKKKTFISARNRYQKDGLPVFAKEKESTSKNDDSQATEGTSSKLVQYSNSFTRKKFAIPTEIQDDEDQI